MVLGVAWAMVGYVVCAALGRGQLVTTIVTAAAGGLGLGAGAIRQYHGHLGGLGAALIGLEITVIVAGVCLAVVFIRGRKPRRKHGSAAVASTRYVLYESPEDIAREARRKERDRIRNARR
jgi:predicted lipid-binding transport protein (Tim44 family)